MNAEDWGLLELAAKAACVKDFVFCAETGAPFDAVGYWNPLEDDGDALRLAVKLCFRVIHYPGHVIAIDPSAGGDTLAEVYGADDHFAATRRAIVRAAAEIGRGMA